MISVSPIPRYQATVIISTVYITRASNNYYAIGTIPLVERPIRNVRS